MTHSSSLLVLHLCSRGQVAARGGGDVGGQECRERGGAVLGLVSPHHLFPTTPRNWKPPAAGPGFVAYDGLFRVTNDKTHFEHNGSAFGCIATEQPFGEAC
jgi:hypothetical protein